MDFKLTEEQLAMQEMAKNFAEKKIAPTMEEDEKEHRFRREIVKEMGRLGFWVYLSGKVWWKREWISRCHLNDGGSRPDFAFMGTPF